MWGPTKNFGRIGSAVLTFIGYKQTNKQTDRQAKYIYIDIVDTDKKIEDKFHAQKIGSSFNSFCFGKNIIVYRRSFDW